MTDHEWSLEEWDDWWKKEGARPDGEVIDSDHHHHPKEGEEVKEEAEVDPYAPAVSEMLKKHWKILFGGTQEKRRVFLTFCGNSLDLKWLSDEGQETVGNDFSTYALEGFMKEHKYDYEASEKGPFKVYKAKKTQLALYAGDFFQMTPGTCGGTFGAVWDTGSFQSAAIKDRKTYARTVASLMTSECKYLLSVVDFKEGRTWNGPPYTITDEIVQETFGDLMTWKLVDQAPWADYVERLFLLQLK